MQCSPVGVDSLEYSLLACGSNKLPFTKCSVLLLELIVLGVVYHLEYSLVACGSNKLSFTMCNVLLLELVVMNSFTMCIVFSCWS